MCIILVSEIIELLSMTAFKTLHMGKKVLPLKPKKETMAKFQSKAEILDPDVKVVEADEAQDSFSQTPPVVPLSMEAGTESSVKSPGPSLVDAKSYPTDKADEGNIYTHK